MNVTVTFTGYEKTYGVYDAAQNAYVQVVKQTFLDPNETSELITPEHELLKTKKVKLAVAIPQETLIKLI